jgi:chromosome segregation ATPase
LSFVVAIFAVVTQLLSAIGAVSLSTTQQLTVWLVTLGLIVLLSIAYMACHTYLTARARLEARLDRRAANGMRIDRDGHSKLGTKDGRITNVQTNGDGPPEQADKAEQARCALAAAEEQLEKARVQAAKAEQEAKAAREQAAKAEQEAKAAREQADEAEREAKVQLAEGMASKIADWQKNKAT